MLSANTTALCILLSRRINDTIHHDDKLGFAASLKRKGKKRFFLNWREKCIVEFHESVLFFSLRKLFFKREVSAFSIGHLPVTLLFPGMCVMYTMACFEG